MKYAYDNRHNDNGSQDKGEKGNSGNYVHGLHRFNNIAYKFDKKVNIIKHVQYSLIIIYMHYEQNIEDNRRNGDIRGQKPLKRRYKGNYGYQYTAQDQKNF